MWRMSTGCLMPVSSFSPLSRSRNSRKFSLEYCVFMSFACAPRLFGCSREVSPTAARDQRTFLVVKVGFGGRELIAHAHHAPLSGKVARHGCLVIVHPDVYRGHRATESGGDRIVCCHIQDRSKNAAMRVSALRVHHPFVAPASLYLDAILACFQHNEVEPLVERSV